MEKDKDKSRDFKRSFALSDEGFERAKRVLLGYFKGAQSVEKSQDSEDKYEHYDYVVTLRNNGYGEAAKIRIDEKTRERGAARFWKNHGEPELAIETWSVKPYDGCPKGKAGWALREDAKADYILYTFDKEDTNKAYLIPFQLLRIALRRYYGDWKRVYGERENVKDNEAWASASMYVPASVVVRAISEEMLGIVS